MRLRVHTNNREELVDITDQVRDLVRSSAVGDGVVHLWSLHTTCGITVNEGFDPDVARDVLAALRRIFPERGDYQHAEGNSDAHLKTAFVGPGETLLIERGALVLGRWQRVFLAEFDGPREREIALAFSPAVHPSKGPPPRRMV